MNWIRELYDTYDHCQTFIGKEDDRGATLLPISYVQANVQIQVMISKEAEFMGAKVIDKEHAATMMPATIDSAKRASDPAAHPLFDKLVYIAKDLPNYSDEKSHYSLYQTQLESWSKTTGSPEILHTLASYLNQGTLVKDLVDDEILFLDEHGKLMKKWQGEPKDKPLIFKVVAGLQEGALVRFVVEDKDKNLIQLWKSKDIQTSFLSYYLPQIKQTGLCLITGEEARITEFHPAYLRFPGDSAKLISGNDKLGFKFLGRCRTKNDVVTIGYEASQKAHNALKWLIQRQGIKQDGQVIVAWGTVNPEILTLGETSTRLFIDEDEPIVTIGDGYADRLRKLLAGYGVKRFADPDENIVVMSLDAATTGRLSIIYYQSLNGSQYLQRIEEWYTSCCWEDIPYYVEDKETGLKVKRRAVGTPSNYTILNAIYGNGDSDSIKKIKKNASERLLHCILDKGKLPREYVNRLFNQFTKLITFDNYYARMDFLAVACAIMRKYYNDLAGKEEWKMNVDLANKNVSYLWGRLLAYAVWIERRALYISKTKERDTNGERFIKQFQLHPMKTWNRLEILLKPYKDNLRRNDHSYDLYLLDREINDIMNTLFEGKLTAETQEPLDDYFMMAYRAQLSELAKNPKKIESEEE